MGRSWYIPNKDFEPDKSKWLTEGNPEEMSQKLNQSSHKGMTQWLSLFPWVCPVPSHMYYTCFLLINTYFTAFHLCGNFFLQSWSARALVTDHWSGAQDLVHSPLWSSPISGWEPKPCSESLHAEATWALYQRWRGWLTYNNANIYIYIYIYMYVCISVMEIFSFNFAVGVCLSTLIKFYTLK